MLKVTADEASLTCGAYSWKRGVQGCGFGVGDEWLGQVVAPRGRWRRLAGQREEEDAAQDHGQDPADDHD